ncbi:hypothetical protein HK098_001158 [Nowakowskiella sp. JEL0407]|nr:hypothetical protein HK098_001158 [Nowakowskiella sp. JEL0407]
MGRYSTILKIVLETTKAVPHPACASQLYTTFIESDTVLQKDGISPQFIASMDNMISISGDIPEALTVRDKLSSAREYYSASFTTNKLAQFSKQLGSIDG